MSYRGKNYNSWDTALKGAWNPFCHEGLGIPLSLDTMESFVVIETKFTVLSTVFFVPWL